jgi:hypothetical protein
MANAGVLALLDCGYPEDCNAYVAVSLVYLAMVFAASNHKERSISAP